MAARPIRYHAEVCACKNVYEVVKVQPKKKSPLTSISKKNEVWPILFFSNHSFFKKAENTTTTIVDCLAWYP